MKVDGIIVLCLIKKDNRINSVIAEDLCCKRDHTSGQGSNYTMARTPQHFIFSVPIGWNPGWRDLCLTRYLFHSLQVVVLQHINKPCHFKPILGFLIIHLYCILSDIKNLGVIV